MSKECACIRYSIYVKKKYVNLLFILLRKCDKIEMYIKKITKKWQIEKKSHLNGNVPIFEALERSYST